MFQLFLNTYIPYGTSGGSNPARGKTFFSSQKRHGRLWGPPSLLLNAYRGYFSWESGRGVKWLPPSSAEIKNEWSYTSTPPTCPYRIDRVHFTCYILHAFMFQIEVRSTFKLSVYHPGVFTKLNKMVLPVKHSFYYCT